MYSREYSLLRITYENGECAYYLLRGNSPLVALSTDFLRFYFDQAYLGMTFTMGQFLLTLRVADFRNHRWLAAVIDVGE